MGFCVSLYVCVTAVCLKRRKRPNILYRTIVRLPFELIPFVLSMFTIVLSLDYTGATKLISSVFSGNTVVLSFGTSSFLSANIINNIPMSVLFSSILENASISGNAYLKAVYSSVAGSNIGAYLTPVGALAGIMWASILKLYGIKLSFKDFVKNGAIIAVPTLAAVLLGIEFII